MRNGCSQFPIAVKHLAKAQNTQSFGAVNVCVCVCVCAERVIGLALTQDINYWVLELWRGEALPIECGVLIKNIIRQLWSVFACVFCACAFSYYCVCPCMGFS